MKLNVAVYGIVAGSYRTQNLIKALLDIPNVNLFYLNPGLLWDKPSLLDKIQRMLIELITIMKADVVILPATRHQYPYKYKLAKFFKKRVVTDFYISFYDTHVNDRKTFEASSVEAKRHYDLDRKSLLESETVIFLNEPEAEYYTETLGIKLTDVRYKVIPVCVDQRVKAKNRYANGLKSKFTICWWGTYIPLHGIDKILEAAKIMAVSGIDFEMFLFGNSEESAVPFRKKVKELDIEAYVEIDNSKSFINGELEPFLMANCDLALGSFGDSEKAKTVFLNKVADSFALEIPVLSMKTKAMDSLISLETDIFICNNTPEDIAASIMKLKNDKQRLLTVASNGYVQYLKLFSYQAFKTQLEEVLGFRKTETS